MDNHPTLPPKTPTRTVADLLDFIEDYQFASVAEIAREFDLPPALAEQAAGMCGLVGGPACYSLHGDTAEEHVCAVGDGLDPDAPLAVQPVAAPTPTKADPRPQQRKAPAKRNPKGAVQRVAAPAAKQEAAPKPTKAARTPDTKKTWKPMSKPEAHPSRWAFKWLQPRDGDTPGVVDTIARARAEMEDVWGCGDATDHDWDRCYCRNNGRVARARKKAK